jgi:hypothetical protein
MAERDLTAREDRFITLCLVAIPTRPRQMLRQPEEKQARATEIAKLQSNNAYWHSTEG